MNGIHGMHKNIEALTFEGCGYRMVSAMNNMNSSGVFLEKKEKMLTNDMHWTQNSLASVTNKSYMNKSIVNM
jgi:hypothetical protein